MKIRNKCIVNEYSREWCLSTGTPHIADPHGCARIWLRVFFWEVPSASFLLQFHTPQWRVQSLDDKAETCRCRLSVAEREPPNRSGSSGPRAAAARPNLAAAAGSHEKWMCETYGQDSVWINDEGMNPVCPGGVRLRARRRSIRPRLDSPPIKRSGKVGQFSKLIPSRFRTLSVYCPGVPQALPYSQVDFHYDYLLSSQGPSVTLYWPDKFLRRCSGESLVALVTTWLTNTTTATRVVWKQGW